MKYLNKKGFTLIEMLGVIVIMGLISIVVFPTISKMIHSNKNQKYEYYTSAIEEGAKTYASTQRTALGGSKYSGCVKITLDDLIKYGYVTKFEDPSVSCKTGASGVVIRNDKGKISIKYELTCTKDEKIIFKTGSNDNNVCSAYTIKEESTLKAVLEADTSLTKEQGIDNNDKKTNTMFITNANANNYVYYSGQLWRVISYNKTTDTVRVIAGEPTTTQHYSSRSGTYFYYANNDAETWLNESYYGLLNEPEKYLVSTIFNPTENNNMNKNPIDNNKLRKSKVGLISLYEYGRIKNWFNTTYNGYIGTYLLTETADKTTMYFAGGNNDELKGTYKTFDNANHHRPVLPVIEFNSDNIVYSGNGTSTNPYRIEKTACSTGNKLSDCNVGEYVKLGEDLYRIMYKTDKEVKVIATKTAGQTIFSDNHYDYTTSDLRKYLESKYKSSLQLKGEFCAPNSSSGKDGIRRLDCSQNPNKYYLTVGPPRLGEMFVVNQTDAYDYWLIDVRDSADYDAEGNEFESYKYVVRRDGRIVTGKINTKHNALATFFLSADLTIKSRSLSGTQFVTVG